MIRDKLTKVIEKHQDKIVDEPRGYIGASIIGSDCLRKIWYEFKGEKSEGVPSKTRRTWDIGKRLEGLVIDWIKEAGFYAQNFQEDYFSDEQPYFKGHFDAIIVVNKKTCILEIKTAKDASFKVFVNKGVKIWNPQYYSQVQAYMGMSGIYSTYILVINKDNSSLSDELVEFDEGEYFRLKEKAFLIANAVCEPPRISNSPLWFQCKLCQFNRVCHE